MKETEQVNLRDKVIICRDCGEEFTWEKGEQQFYESKGFDPPRRCPDCRRDLKLKKRREDRREARDG